MKYIQKKSEPEEFTKWKSNGNRGYRQLANLLKAEVKLSLMQEQGYICCYCESRLVENDSHIEHFKPQSSYSALELDYGNMHCSCLNQLGVGTPCHCGHLKLNWYDDKLLISPMDKTCEKRFKFDIYGGVQARDNNDKPAMETIEKLGLNIPKLRALRKEAIDAFNSPDITNEEQRTFFEDYLKKDSNGMWNPYWTTIHYLLP